MGVWGLWGTPPPSGPGLGGGIFFNNFEPPGGGGTGGRVGGTEGLKFGVFFGGFSRVGQGSRVLEGVYCDFSPLSNGH